MNRDEYYNAEDLRKISDLNRTQARAFIHKYGEIVTKKLCLITARKFHALYMQGYVDEFIERWNRNADK